jgi:hypothetical protein
MTLSIGPGITLGPGITITLPITATAGNTTSVSVIQNTAISSFSPFASVINGTQPYTYFVSSGTLPTGITINASTGVVSGTPTVAYPLANVVFSVKDSEDVIAETTSTVAFTVTPPISAVAGATSTVSGYQNSAINSFNPFSSVTGGTLPYTYFISAGALPAGITINSSTGLVSGTPTTTYSTANVTFSVQDANSVVASTTKTVGFTVNAALTATAGATTTVSVPQNTAISSFNPFSSVTGGFTPYTYFVSAGTLPNGITINPSTGLVSGTPTTVQGAANVTFSVRDVNNVTAATTRIVSFTVTSASVTISYLIVAGGGASGARGGPQPGASGYAYGAGGGAGGVRQGSVTVTPGATYNITIGGGGSTTAGSSLGSQQGGSGTPSSFIGTGVSLTSTGGGGGGGASPSGNGSTGATGGSGGGGAVWRPTSSTGTQTGYGGGNGNTPPVSPSQGNPGGTAFPSGPPSFSGSAGGGGAGGAGTSGVRQAPPSPTSGIAAGGAGITSTITGSNTNVGGGGQGGGFGSSPSPSISFGGGGSNTPQTAGVINTGGGGASSTNGSNGGGSGLIIVKAPTPAVTINGTFTTGPDGLGNTWYRFTSSGNITY